MNRVDLSSQKVINSSLLSEGDENYMFHRGKKS
jgi:hypothetical protein